METCDYDSLPLWSNKSYKYLNKKSKYISEFTINQKNPSKLITCLFFYLIS